jgi:hypothetical protein
MNFSKPNPLVIELDTASIHGQEPVSGTVSTDWQACCINRYTSVLVRFVYTSKDGFKQGVLLAHPAQGVELDGIRFSVASDCVMMVVFFPLCAIPVT